MKFSETEKIELKEKVNDSLIKEIETFLNTEGGTINVGISDKGDVLWINNIDKTLRQISNIITDQIEPNAIDSVKIEVEIIDGKLVIKITVKKGYASLYCIKKFGFSYNGSHYRVGSTSKSMTIEMIKKDWRSNFLI